MGQDERGRLLDFVYPCRRIDFYDEVTGFGAMRKNLDLIGVVLCSLSACILWSFVNSLYIQFLDAATNERFLMIDIVDLTMIVAAKIDRLAAPAINIIFRTVLSDANERLIAGPGLTIGAAFGALASFYLVACSASKAITTFLNGPNLQNSLRRFRLAIYVVEVALCLLAAGYISVGLLAYFDAAISTRLLGYAISAFTITVALYGLASFAAYWCVPAVRQIASQLGFRK